MASKFCTEVLVVLAVGLGIAWFCVWLHEHDVCPLRSLKKTVRKLSIVGICALALWTLPLIQYGSTKGGNGGTNVVQMVVGPGGTGTTGILPVENGNPDSALDEWENFTPITSTNTTQTLTGDDFRRGFVMTHVGTDEAHDFSPPPEAAVCADWRAFGAAEDWFYVTFTNWTFQVGTNSVNYLRIHSDGWAETGTTGILPVGGGNTGTTGVSPVAWAATFSPFKTVLGIAPEANWVFPSEFWHYVTPSNTLQLTWRNALLGLDTNTPVDVQMEAWPDGRFAYRYDLTNVKWKMESGEWTAADLTNVVIGASLGSIPLRTTLSDIATNVTFSIFHSPFSICFYPLSADDAVNLDRDGDGITLLDELYAYGSDPDLWDTDGDGVSDGDEVASGANPLVRDQGEGLTGGTASPEFLSECGAAANRLVAWEIVPSAFSFARPEGLTNIVSRTFRVDRASPWQQLYVSSRPNGAAGWESADVAIRYGVDGGPVTNEVPLATFDSWRVPLGTNAVTNLTFTVAAAGDAPALSRPLHLLRWSPHVALETDEAGRFLDVPEGKAPVFLSRRREGSGWYVVPFTASSAGVPHVGGVDAAAAAELALPPCEGLAVTNVPSRAFLAPDPVWAELPPEGTNAAVRVCCWELAHETPGMIGSGPRASQFDSPYPLSSPALRKAFHRAQGIGADPSSPVTVRILPRHPLVGLCVNAASTPHLRGSGSSTNDAPGEVDAYPPSTITPSFDRTPDDDDAYTLDADTPDEGVEESPAEDDDGGCGSPDPEKDDCGCAGDEDGTSQCSFRLRISLGSPTPGEDAGFVWTSLDEPTAVTPAVFNVLGTDAVAATTNVLGEFTVVCSAPAGRTVQVTNVAHGVAITVWNASGRLENRWEVTNPDGDSRYVRCRKLTILGNAVSDETFVLGDDMLGAWGAPEESRVADAFPNDCFERTDETRGVTTVKLKWRMDPDEPDFVTDVRDMTFLADGTCVASAMSEYVKVGVGSSARRRLACRYGHDGKCEYEEEMDYWCDPANPYRHARLRSVRSSRRPWSFHDYDALGRETATVEQLDGSPFPGDLAEVSHLAELPPYCSAKATVTSYEPQAGDSRDRNDAFLPRRRDTWVMRAGKAPILVGTETWLYTRTVGADGLPRRTCVRSSGIGDALRGETTVSYPDDYSVPKELRGRTISHTAFDGVVSSCQIEKGTWDSSAGTFAPNPDGTFLRITTRRTGGSSEQDTYSVEVEDALRRLTVFSATCLTAGDAVVAFEESTYDDIDRLRSTTYLDGTSLTNAYSCCRLLWSRDRQNRKTLRSAQTGTDDLYHAIEEPWLSTVANGKWRMENGKWVWGANESATNGFKVTQHFCDALGRETNTVVGIAYTPGEAMSPASILHSSFSIFHSSYPADAWQGPYWGPYSIRTDERGKETLTWESHYHEYTRVDEEIHTNGVYLSGSITTTMRNGGVTVARYWDNPDGSHAWTEETRSTDWMPDGRRVVTVSTTASDNRDASYNYVAVTNSVTTYDLFGRVSTISVCGANGSRLVTSNFYDGVSDRILTTTKTGSLPVNYAYDEFGERIGMIQGVRSVWNRTTYETISQEVYRVVTSVRMTGSTTNSVQIQKTQLTGLSNSCRRHTITLTGNAAILAATGTTGALPVENGSVTDSLTTYDPSTGIETTTTRTDGQTPVVTRSLHGIPLEQASLGERRTMAYDAFGQNVFNVLENARTGTTNRTEYIEYDISGNAVRRTADYGADGVAVSTAEFDMLNREVRRTDALGHVTETAYDGLGRPVSVGGDTYPLRTGYDTQGRKTSSSTTRDNGATWDETQWEFDPASGVNTAKVYADGSRISYDYTDNGQRTRTTWARGAWKQHAYNDRNLVSGTTYSGTATPSVAYAYDDSDKLASATLSDGTSYAYTYDDSLLCTNEAMTIAEDNFTVMRTYDSFQRNEETAVVITNIRHAAKTRLYDSESRVCGYALTNSFGRGMNVSLRYDGSYLTNMVYALPNGNHFTVNLTRKASRKELVTLRDYSFGAQSVYWYSTDYDLIGRPTNATDSVSLMREWLYNNRSELAAASIGTNLYGYSYDTIGNRLWSAANLATNTYIANALNQYTSVGRGVLDPPQTSALIYDADGNMTRDDRFLYSYDAENRLRLIISSVVTNGALRVQNAYDHRNRRIRKTIQRLSVSVAQPPSPPVEIREWLALETHTFVWDGNNIVLEKVDFADGTIRTFEYFWGLDKSGTEQGAGGVGGLIAVSMDGVFYIPCYDHNGNIVLYVSEIDGIAAQYTYDPYGNIIDSSGPLADVFSFGFSTKYHDRETGMVGYKRRFYGPVLGRWLNRDPIEEAGGENLYAFCNNNSLFYIDIYGMTKVSIDMKLVVEDAGNIQRDFLHIAVTVLEEPKGRGFLNFIQLKKSAGTDWSLDWDKRLGPYYYSLVELGEHTRFNVKGQRVITLKDAPGGAISDPTWFYVAIVEVHERCQFDKTGRYILKCYDKVRIIASRVWKYVPFEEQPFVFQNQESKINMLPELKKIVNTSKWRSNLCPNTQVEIQ